MPISTLPLLAKALGVSIEELVGEQPRPCKRGPAPKLQQKLEQLQALPRAKQRLVSEVLDSLSAAGKCVTPLLALFSIVGTSTRLTVARPRIAILRTVFIAIRKCLDDELDDILIPRAIPGSIPV